MKRAKSGLEKQSAGQSSESSVDGPGRRGAASRSIATQRGNGRPTVAGPARGSCWRPRRADLLFTIQCQPDRARCNCFLRRRVAGRGHAVWKSRLPCSAQQEISESEPVGQSGQRTPRFRQGAWHAARLRVHRELSLSLPTCHSMPTIASDMLRLRLTSWLALHLFSRKEPPRVGDAKGCGSSTAATEQRRPVGQSQQTSPAPISVPVRHRRTASGFSLSLSSLLRYGPHTPSLKALATWCGRSCRGRRRSWRWHRRCTWWKWRMQRRWKTAAELGRLD